MRTASGECLTENATPKFERCNTKLSNVLKKRKKIVRINEKNTEMQCNINPALSRWVFDNIHTDEEKI